MQKLNNKYKSSLSWGDFFYNSRYVWLRNSGIGCLRKASIQIVFSMLFHMLFM